MASKFFEVGDVLPAGQVKINWDYSSGLGFEDYQFYIEGTNSFLIGVVNWGGMSGETVIFISGISGEPVESRDSVGSYTISLSNGVTITDVNSWIAGIFTWEVVPPGFSVTFEENGGTNVTDLTEQTNLPSPLPTTTKANHVFAGWYYDNLFTQKANAGDELTTNVTLYAKWYTPTTWCEDIADAIREKEGGSEPIKHVDFPDRIRALESGVDVSDANAVVGEVLTGKTFYAVDDTKKTGTMPNRGTVNTDITTKAQEVTIQQGYHSGSGKVKISTTEQAKIIASNIKSGVTILGQEGAVTPAKEEETKTVTPNFSSGNVVVTPTSGKVMSQVTINKDGNLIADNIKKDVTVHGITGNSFVTIELTQAQYDALTTKDSNTYYLIVEE